MNSLSKAVLTLALYNRPPQGWRHDRAGSRATPIFLAGSPPRTASTETPGLAPEVLSMAWKSHRHKVHKRLAFGICATALRSLRHRRADFARGVRKSR